MPTTPDPRHVAAAVTMRRIHAQLARRDRARKNGYRGALTRNELAALTLARQS